MPKIKTRDDLIKYALLKHGSPMHNVEVTNEQFQIVIDDCIDMFRRCNYGEGSIFSHGVFEVKAGKTQYNLRSIDSGFIRDNYGNIVPSSTDLSSPSFEDGVVNISAVLEIKISGSGRNGINTLFSTDNLMFADNNGRTIFDNLFSANSGSSDFVTTNQPGTIGTSAGSKYDYLMPITNFVQKSAYYELFNKFFKVEYEAIYRAQEGILNIYPTPTSDDIAMITYWAKENEKALFNNPLFKQYFVAEVQKQWGANLKKYSVTLAGGGEIDGQGLYDNAVEQIEMIMEEINGESEPPAFFIM